MLKRVGVKSSDYFSSNESAKYNKLLRNAKSQQEVDEILSILESRFEADIGFTSSVNKFVSMVDDVHQGIDGDNFLMRYQTYAVRVLEPLQVFADLFSGYLAAEKSQLIVGVNIVAPENNIVALNDYTLHMRMYNYLARKYPNVNRALHAGELALGMVRPKDLTFHIQQALDIAQAQRIGHGVDLPFEQKFIDLLRNLKEKAAIEINLTSNEFILGIEGNKHPYLIYSSYDVPLVISTDDSGVSRNNLTNEYLLLATRYQPKYDRIKEYVYNSIEYSFLDQAIKSVLKKNIDVQFIVFESDMAGLYKSLNQ
jgi:adenosine deaminase/adenosine deaminase CECR1